MDSEIEKIFLDYFKLLVETYTVAPCATRPLLENIAEKLKEAGNIQVRILPAVGSGHGILLARVGPIKDEGGLMLSGHVDVVSANDQKWKRYIRPYHLTQRGQRFYGRGTTDMKAFDALALTLLHVWSRSRDELTEPLYVILTPDEETGMRGARQAIRHMEQYGPRPHLIVVGEPSNGKVIYKHKGSLRLTFELTGKSAHASDPGKGINVIFPGAHIITFTERLKQQMGEGPGAPEFEVAHDTFSPGIFQAGNTANTVPEEGRIVISIRFSNDAQAQSIIEQYQTMCRELERQYGAEDSYQQFKIYQQLKIEVSSRIIPVFEGEPNGPAVRALRKAKPLIAAKTAMFASEAAFFSKLAPTVIFGPGSIKQAHIPNEFIKRNDIIRTWEVLHQLVGLQCRSQCG